MSSRWYRKVDDGEVGPVSFQDLVALSVAGTLTEDDWVRRELSPEWIRARAVIGLFQAAEKKRPVSQAEGLPNTSADSFPAALIASPPAGSQKSKARLLEPLDWWILGVAAVLVLIVNLCVWWPASRGRFPEHRVFRRSSADADPRHSSPEFKRIEERTKQVGFQAGRDKT